MLFQSRGGFPLTRGGRWSLAVWALLLSGGFLLACSVEPDPRLFGTHQRLGLPPCSFRVLFGIPCPSCGMTTSFAFFTRGQFIEAARANVAGLLLAILCAIQIPWCCWSAATGRLWQVSEPVAVLVWLLLVISFSAMLNWVWQFVPVVSAT